MEVKRTINDKATIEERVLKARRIAAT